MGGRRCALIDEHDTGVHPRKAKATADHREIRV
jgi:hypothetical protein